MQAKQFIGTVVLVDIETGEPHHASVAVSLDDETITYTAISTDRSRRKTITGRHEENPLFVEMMQTVEEVAREPA